jgi:hypothetical protein
LGWSLASSRSARSCTARACWCGRRASSCRCCRSERRASMRGSCPKVPPWPSQDLIPRRDQKQLGNPEQCLRVGRLRSGITASSESRPPHGSVQSQHSIQADPLAYVCFWGVARNVTRPSGSDNALSVNQAWHDRAGVTLMPRNRGYRQEGETLARRLGWAACALSRSRHLDAGHASEAGVAQAPPRHRMDAPVGAPVTLGPRLRAAARSAQAARPRGNRQAVARRRGGQGRQGGAGVSVPLTARAPAAAAAW